MIDLLCEDYQQAKANRRMVRLKQNISEYVRIEALVRGWPRKKPLPESLYGMLPMVGKHETKELSGFHEVDNFE